MKKHNIKFELCGTAPTALVDPISQDACCYRLVTILTLMMKHLKLAKCREAKFAIVSLSLTGDLAPLAYKSNRDLWTSNA
jgi:hypothetical protein